MKAITRHFFKTAAATLALAWFVSQAQADLIDLGERTLTTPLTGLSSAQAYIETDQGLAPGTLTYFNSFDSDVGWRNNGTLDSSYFGVTLSLDETTAAVNWDLSTSGFQLSYVFLKDGREKGGIGYHYHLYGVTPDEVFQSMGDQTVEIDGIRLINYVAFFGVPGSPNVPEGGATLILLSIGLGAIELMRRIRVCRPARIV
jgi:hypothetical protein